METFLAIGSIAAFIGLGMVIVGGAIGLYKAIRWLIVATENLQGPALGVFTLVFAYGVMCLLPLYLIGTFPEKRTELIGLSVFSHVVIIAILVMSIEPLTRLAGRSFDFVLRIRREN